MPNMPRPGGIDSSIAFLREGYEFGRRRSEALQSDAFQTRLLLQRTIFLTGADGARLFYSEDLFRRAGAMPARVQKTLTGEGGVQGTDGEEHRLRKAMFLDLMSPESRSRLVGRFEDEWQAKLPYWRGQSGVVLLDELAAVLCRATCAWAGIPLSEHEAPGRTEDLAHMIDGAGGIGLRHWKGRAARRRSEKWIGDLVRQVRRGHGDADDASILGAIAKHRDARGRLLPERVAAVEVLNVLRPVVAVNRYIAFLALALHSYPRAREALRSGTVEPEWFVHEVRRFYPFFPMAVARVRRDFRWRGYRFPAGTRTVLDLYGTNRDFRLWSSPDEFEPERFADWSGDPFELVPQGGGDHQTGHRCAGEWLTIDLMCNALRQLERMDYSVPPQDLRLDTSRIPAGPASGFVITSVRANPQRTARSDQAGADASTGT